MRVFILCLLSLSVLSSCGWAKNIQSRKNRVLFENQYFPARLTTTREDKLAFSVSVDRIDQGLVPAREAGRFEATKYCIDKFGRSDVIWTQGPDVEDAELQLDNGRLILEGRCDV